MSDAALRTTAVDSGPLVTKASVDARNATTKTAAAASVQVEERIAYRFTGRVCCCVCCVVRLEPAVPADGQVNNSLADGLLALNS